MPLDVRPLPEWAEGYVPAAVAKASALLADLEAKVGEAQAALATAEVEVEKAKVADEKAAREAVAKGKLPGASAEPEASERADAARRAISAGRAMCEGARRDLVDALGNARRDIVETVDAEALKLGEAIGTRLLDIEAQLMRLRHLRLLRGALNSDCLIGREATFNIQPPRRQRGREPLPDGASEAMAALRGAISGSGD